jgi:hypothetical protein
LEILASRGRSTREVDCRRLGRCVAGNAVWHAEGVSVSNTNKTVCGLFETCSLSPMADDGRHGGAKRL